MDTMDDIGIVYAATSPKLVKKGDREFIKIGQTKDLDRRKREMRISALGLDYIFAVECNNYKRIEKALHAKYSDKRDENEFFLIKRSEIFKDLQFLIATGAKSIDLGDDTDDTQSTEQTRKSNIDLSKLGINPGETLVYIKDETITAEVINHNTIKFRDEETTLSGAASKLENHRVSGSLYWLYKGDALSVLRSKKEEE